MFDFERFDYETKRAVYSECEQVNCPNLETKFIEEFLKRDYTVVFVTVNQPCKKIEKNFGEDVLQKYPKLIFVDCVSEKGIKTQLNVCYPKGRTLEEKEKIIRSTWKKIKGKKMLFFDCAELLFKEYDEKETFEFIHKTIQHTQQEGVVVFCFLKQTLTQPLENLVRHLFDQTIFL